MNIKKAIIRLVAIIGFILLFSILYRIFVPIDVVIVPPPDCELNKTYIFDKKITVGPRTIKVGDGTFCECKYGIYNEARIAILDPEFCSSTNKRLEVNCEKNTRFRCMPLCDVDIPYSIAKETIHGTILDDECICWESQLTTYSKENGKHYCRLNKRGEST